MWTRQDPWADICAPFVSRIERCLQRNERPPIPYDMPEPLRTLITACWQKNFRERPTAKDILTKHLPQIDSWLQAETALKLVNIRAERKKGGSMLVAPVTPRTAVTIAKVSSGGALNIVAPQTPAGDLAEFTPRTKAVALVLSLSTPEVSDISNCKAFMVPHSLSTDSLTTASRPSSRPARATLPTAMPSPTNKGASRQKDSTSIAAMDFLKEVIAAT